MAKLLLTQKNVENHICRETCSLYAEKDMIIPPGIKDYLQTIGIAIQYGPKPGKQDAPGKPVAAAAPETAEPPAADGEITTLTKRIVAILRNEYQVEDEETLHDLCLQVVKQINI